MKYTCISIDPNMLKDVNSKGNVGVKGKKGMKRRALLSRQS